MNISSHNFAHYRLSYDGRGSYTLFNRETDRVYEIQKTEYDYILGGQINHGSFGFTRCELVEQNYESDRIDVA